MKKLLIFLFGVILLTGCDNTLNSPKGEVEKLFMNYNSLNSDVLIQLDKVIEAQDLTKEQKILYKDILKRQYSDLSYEIVSEVITDNTAIVSVDIEVYDFKKTVNDADEYLRQNIDVDVWNYKLNKLKEETERVKYTIDLSLTKIDNAWHIDELTENDRQKIHGLY